MKVLWALRCSLTARHQDDTKYILYFLLQLLSETVDLVSCHIFQNDLQGGDSMSHLGHGDELSQPTHKCWEHFAMTLAHDLLATGNQCWSAITLVGNAELFPLSSLNGLNCEVWFREFSQALLQPVSFLETSLPRQLDSFCICLRVWAGRQLSWLWMLQKNQNRCMERWW